MAYRRTPAVQARLDAQRAAVLQAAVALLAERGYAGCSMAAVAERAGIATGSMYRHFSGKSELAVELFRTVVSREVAAVTEAVARESTPQRRVAAVVETFAARALKAPGSPTRCSPSPPTPWSTPSGWCSGRPSAT
ncbi:TetR/AcrR family transcriptional regulator [Kitasatospora paranensis]|uniref:TetR/AcrR family transcriptional regulator n=1 Tax=Kitasatospora paranensis TaxID=258053 RepID=UPI003CD095D4